MANIIIPDGGTIGSTSDTDAITISSTGKVTTADSELNVKAVNGSTTHTFTVKGIGETIYEDDGTTVVDADSGQFAVYNGSTKLLGITEHGYVLKPKIPAFLATAPTSFTGDGTVAGSEPFQYTNEVVNVGNCYNTSNSTFTAPVDGNYQINWWASVSSSSNNARYFRLRLLKNNSLYLNPHNSVSDETNNADYNLCGGSSVVSLSAGDFLHVEFGSSLATSNYSFYSNFCFFSGYLIG